MPKYRMGMYYTKIYGTQSVSSATERESSKHRERTLKRGAIQEK